MSTPSRRPLTGGEREMLRAIGELLDIPRPETYEDRQGYFDTLSSRAAMLVGCLDVATESDQSSVDTVTRSARHFAEVNPLRYVAESPQRRAERHAETDRAPRGDSGAVA